MVAFRFYSFFRFFITDICRWGNESPHILWHNGFLLTADKIILSFLRVPLQNEVWVIGKLAHSSDKGENICIIILKDISAIFFKISEAITYQDHALSDIGVEFTLTIAVNTVVQIQLLLVEVVSAYFDDTGW